ncbi:MAG: hypothetical protein EP343_03450 [Deltaproteobacteria bacterium]|nr:MAG: hypothetical protein EP343_03450 [Deltaproteobacteria bacterium]
MRKGLMILVAGAMCLTGCASHLVSLDKQNVARAKFERLNLRFKQLEETRLSVTYDYVKDRRSFKRHADRAGRLLKEFVVQTRTVGKGKAPHEWTYAAFYRAAGLSEVVGMSARRLEDAYRRRGQRHIANAYGKISQKFLRGSYAAYMAVLFLADYFHQRYPDDQVHTTRQNNWLIRSNSARCNVSSMAKLSRVNHSNLTWGLADKIKWEGMTPGDMRSLLMKFMKKERFKYCKSIFRK